MNQMTFYEKGKRTVVLNMSGSVLALPLRTLSKKPVVLHPRKGKAYIDIEDQCDQHDVVAALDDLETMTKAGKIAWYPKKSRPDSPNRKPPMVLPRREGETSVAPPNEFDKKLNVILQKERDEDERTKASSSNRNMERTEPGQITVEAASHNQTRFANNDSGEVDGHNLRAEPLPGPYDEVPVGTLVDAALKLGVITKAGSHLMFEAEAIANGIKAAYKAVEVNEELTDRIRAAMNAQEVVGQ